MHTPYVLSIHDTGYGKRSQHKLWFIDQTRFKTKEQFHFDTLILSEDVLEILDRYISHIRPLQTPKCEYVVISTAGSQFSAMGNALSLLVLEAIGKYYISPTRYRQIVETESSIRLNKKEQETLSKDQKHSSRCAKLNYQKSLSRDVALDGVTCMQKLVGEQREAHTSALAAELRDAPNITESVSDSILTDNADASQVIDVDDCTEQSATASETIDKEGLEVKKEELENETDKKRDLFTTEEDEFLRRGYEKYAKVPMKWAKILKDPEYTFHTGRTRDTIRVRASTLNLGKKKKSKK